jgi:superfamily II RNA helicase
MSYCHEHAIPHSEFLEWDPEDRAKTLAFAMESAVRCQMCGTAPWEWEENKFAFTAVDEFCQGCYQKSMYSDTQGSSLPGTNVRLIPTTPQLTAQMAMKAKKRRSLKME